MLAGAATVLVSAAVAQAANTGASAKEPRSEAAPHTSSTVTNLRLGQRSQFSAQSGEGPGAIVGLPPVSKNLDLVSKLTFSRGPGGSIAAGQIADLSVFKKTAYLNSWAQPAPDCDRGGIFVVDISNPAAPRETAFLPSEPGSYHGEGAHVISVDTPAFKGDLLAVNNEPCAGVTAPGGFDLYDVTDPANPQALVKGAGDRGPEGSLTGDKEFANSSHSVFLWAAGRKAYLVAQDNTELNDVDIFDVSNPRAPQPVGEYDLVEVATAQGHDVMDDGANGNQVFNHDMVVKEIGGVQTLLDSYWDSGYLKFDVTDPANPRYLGDTTFDGADPLTGLTPPEGNGHQAEFSGDNKYILGADEDFSPYRLTDFEMTTGPDAGAFPAGEFGWTVPIRTLDEGTLNGPTIFGGYGCGVSDDLPDPAGLTVAAGEEKIVVLERGPIEGTDPEDNYPACTFQEKADNAAAAGYDAVIIANHHTGSSFGATPDSALCGSGTGADVVGVCVGHRLMHLLFGIEPDYSNPYDDDLEPQIGDLGEKVSTQSLFDGWGYMHLFENSNGKIREIDAHAVPESLDERFAFGFGDLSVHEFATDPNVPLAYSAYYSAGARVIAFGADGLKEVGSFIDDRGNNFWGVEQFTDASGNRLIALSDRDYGLYILKYTGPGAYAPPAASPPPAPAPSSGVAGATAARPAATMAISGKALRVSRTGVASIAVTCPGEAKGACEGTVRLASGKLNVGSKKFSVRPGATSAVKVKFTSSAQRALRARRSLRVQVIVDAAAAGVRASSTRRITVRAAKRLRG